MADPNEFDLNSLSKEQIVEWAKHYGREVGRGAALDSLALYRDRESPLTIPEKRMIEISQAAVREETDRILAQSKEEMLRTLREIGLDTSEKDLPAKVRAALVFPASSWSFVKWAGATFLVAVLTAFASLVAPWFGKVR